MTQQELLDMLKQHGLSQNKLAEVMDVDISTVSRWCLGKIKMGKAWDRLLRMYFESLVT